MAVPLQVTTTNMHGDINLHIVRDGNVAFALTTQGGGVGAGGIIIPTVSYNVTMYRVPDEPTGSEGYDVGTVRRMCAVACAIGVIVGAMVMVRCRQ